MGLERMERIRVLLILFTFFIFFTGCIDKDDTRKKEVLIEFLSERLTDEQISNHFEITNVNNQQVFFTLNYGEYPANTKVSSAEFSGFARIVDDRVVDYYGPLKEYGIQVQKTEADEIFAKNNCIGDPYLEIGDTYQQGVEDLRGVY